MKSEEEIRAALEKAKGRKQEHAGRSPWRARFSAIEAALEWALDEREWIAGMTDNE